MLDRLEIEHFRGLGSLSLSGLRRVNVLIGPNNVGKTSVLEALYLLHEVPVMAEGHRGDLGGNTGTVSGAERKSIDRLLRRRGYQAGGEAAHWYSMLVSQSAAEGERIRLTGGSQDLEQTLEIGRQGAVRSGSPASRSDTRSNAVFFDFEATSDEVVSDRIGLFKERREKGRLVELLQQIEPRLVDVDQLKVTGSTCPETWVDIGTPRLTRLTQLGYGLRYATALFTQLLELHGSIVLIDQVEVGLHHLTHKAVWQALESISRSNNLQLFLTTHSYECLRAADQAMVEHPNDLVLLRLERVADGRLVAFRLGPTERDAVFHYGSEVR